LVLASIAFSNSASLEPSTKRKSMPYLGRVYWKRLYVPPYSDALVTMLSPARARLRIVSVSAAWPDATPQRPYAALEGGDPLLEDVGCRVHDPGVDVAEFLQPEEPGGVVGVVEDVAGGGVDRDGARLRRGSTCWPAWTARVSRRKAGVFWSDTMISWTGRSSAASSQTCGWSRGALGWGVGFGRPSVVSSGETKNRGSASETAAPD